MTDPFTITVTWAELALLAAVHFAAGCHCWHTLTTGASRRMLRRDIPERQGEEIQL